MDDTNTPEWQDNDNITAIKQQTIMDDVTGGTLNIQSKGKTYLPEYFDESSTDYTSRIKNSELLPTTSEAIKSITGKLLSKPTQFNDIDTDNVFDITNIDGMGSTFKAFESQALFKTNKYGMTLNLIDFESVGSRTKAQENADNIKPYYKTILASQIINKRTSLINSRMVLSQVTIKESITESDGDFGTKEVEQYRVYKLEMLDDNQVSGVSVTIWQKTTNGIAITEEPRMLDIGNMKEITLVPMYSGDHGYLNAIPPFAEMAQINLSVYRMNSGLKRTITNVGDPTHVIKSDNPPMDEQGNPKPIVVGSSNMIVIGTDDDYKIVGMSPDSIQPTKDEIQTMKNDMAKISADMESTEADKTATEVNINDSNSKSKLMQIALSDENCWNKSYEFYCAYLGEAVVGEIVVNKDFSSSKLTPEEFKALQEAKQMGDISHLTLLKEAQKGEWLTTIDDIEVEVEVANNEIESQLPLV